MCELFGTVTELSLIAGVEDWSSFSFGFRSEYVLVMDFSVCDVNNLCPVSLCEDLVMCVGILRCDIIDCGC